MFVIKYLNKPPGDLGQSTVDGTSSLLRPCQLDQGIQAHVNMPVPTDWTLIPHSQSHRATTIRDLDLPSTVAIATLDGGPVPAVCVIHIAACTWGASKGLDGRTAGHITAHPEIKGRIRGDSSTCMEGIESACCYLYVLLHYFMTFTHRASLHLIDWSIDLLHLHVL